MVYLPAIGFGILVISLRIMMLWRNLQGRGNVLIEGLIAIAIGLIAWLSGTFVSGDIVLRNTGYTIMFIGFISLVQWTVQTGRGKLNQVRFWGLFTASLGGLLVIVWAIWWFISGH